MRHCIYEVRLNLERGVCVTVQAVDPTDLNAQQQAQWNALASHG